MVATYSNIATNMTKLIRKTIYNLYSKRQYDDSNFLVRVEINSLGYLKPMTGRTTLRFSRVQKPVFLERRVYVKRANAFSENINSVKLHLRDGRTDGRTVCLLDGV